MLPVIGLSKQLCTEQMGYLANNQSPTYKFLRKKSLGHGAGRVEENPDEILVSLNSFKYRNILASYALTRKTSSSTIFEFTTPRVCIWENTITWAQSTPIKYNFYTVVISTPLNSESCKSF